MLTAKRQNGLPRHSLRSDVVRRLRFEPLEDRHLLAAVTSFTLINADTDLPLGPLTSGQTINLANLASPNLNVRADTIDDIGSVRFGLDSKSNFRTENTDPYALFGDENGDYKPGTFNLGSHTLTATPFSQRNAGGTAGTALAISFTVINESTPVNQPPTINAGTDQSITLPTNSVSLDATVTDDNFPSNPLTTTWTKFSGPGTVTFGNADSVDTTATFSQAGTYVLRLAANDGQYLRTDDVQITVNTQTSGPTVTSLTLINADTDQPLFPLTSGQTINLGDLPTQNLNVRADTAGTIGSVRFSLDTTANFRTENTEPYALFGDNNGNYSAGSFSLGSHTLTARPFSGANGSGTAGTALAISFTVVNPSPPGVSGFTLINALTDQPMFTITEGMSIDLAQLATTQVSIRANTGNVGSVAFDYDGTSNVRVDSSAPYALFSETGGNFQPVVLGLGNHSVTARAFSGSGGGGTLINSLTLNFQVVVAHPIPDQIHLSWKDGPSTTFTVLWRTYNTATASVVQYRQLGAATWLSRTGVPKTSGTAGTLHETTITGLLPSTQYEYRVAGDAGIWSDAYITKTAPPPGDADFDFVYFADTGLIGRGDGLATGTQQIINDIADLNPLLLLGGGDYAYYNTDKRFGPLDAHIDAWFNQSAPFLTQSVFMPTLGNHEVLLQESYDAWIQRFALPPSQTDNFRIYSFDVGQVHFVSILAVNESTDLPDSQVSWIIQDVQNAQARGQSWIIPYMHVSAFSDGSSHASNVALRNQLGPVFEQLGVHLVISSHDQNYERTFPLTNVGNGSPVVSDSALTGYDENDGIVWLKVSPAGKLSNKGSDFSMFQTTPPPYWTALRDDTMHHFARFIVSSDNTLTTQIYATPGDGTPSFVFDSFTYSLGSAQTSQTARESQSIATLATGLNRAEALPVAVTNLRPAITKVQDQRARITDRPSASVLRPSYLDHSMLALHDKAFTDWKSLSRQPTSTEVISIASSRSDYQGANRGELGELNRKDAAWESAFESLKL